jgi:hypothetical protein
MKKMGNTTEPNRTPKKAPKLGNTALNALNSQKSPKLGKTHLYSPVLKTPANHPL